MPYQRTPKEARDLLAQAIKQAEQNLLGILAVGEGKNSVALDPYTALVALATYTGFVIEGGAVQVQVSDLLNLMEFIATDSRYTPDPRFPWTKAQLAAALQEEQVYPVLVSQDGWLSWRRNT